MARIRRAIVSLWNTSSFSKLSPSFYRGLGCYFGVVTLHDCISYGSWVGFILSMLLILYLVSKELSRE